MTILMILLLSLLLSPAYHAFSTGTRHRPMDFAVSTTTRLDEASFRDERADKTPGWRRAISRVLRKKRRTNSNTFMVSSSVTGIMNNYAMKQRLPATTIAWNNFTDITSYATNYKTWDTKYLWTQEQQVLPSLPNMTTATHIKPLPSRFEGGSVAARMTRSYVEHFLFQFISKRTISEPKLLTISVAPSLGPMLFRGHLHADLMATFKNLVFPPISISSGVLEAKHVTCNVLSFMTPDLLRQAQIKRYPAPFQLHFNNFTWTEKDLMNSPCIVRNLEGILMRVLSKVSRPDQLKISHIHILPTGQLSISGFVTFLKIPFIVRAHVEPTRRGHVLTLNNVEVSVAGTSLVKVYDVFHVDIGHAARILQIGFEQGKLVLTAQATITPKKLVEYQQSKASYYSHASLDVGQWLTKLGRFTV